ncbi:ABC transporter permease [Mucilaginibacter segetis]|uniref:ABC transporter permease n=1 Tax=Mucilaginibacter segetis TaxID=2793071 RepID=A0A934PR13_9SPHI|nr:ABC transporter permease [Mucilaginibacter segetis]MBK0379174.1 ABC transporter permease [Mucilaginibacter segetis]
MFKNYLKIALRNIAKQRLYSAINITGLAVAIAVCMMIMMYVVHEHSYDDFHHNAKRIYKLQAKIEIGGNTMNMAYMSYATGPIIKQRQPVVKQYMRTLRYFKPLVINNPELPDRKFSEDNLLFVDPGFFDFFSFNLITGNKANVLTKPFTVVISKHIAQKYFGKQNPVGKLLTIRTDSSYNYQITGVAENCPSNSSIQYNFIVSGASLLGMKEAAMYTGKQGVGPGSFDNYLLLSHASDTTALNRGLKSMVKNDKSLEGETFNLSALTDTHLKNNYDDSSHIRYLKIFPLIALLILLLALVNYMSLSTARSTLRAKEVGVRKVSGASRKTLAIQFYIESTIVACLAFLVGFILFYAFKPWFTNVLQLKIDNAFLLNPVILSLFIALFILIVLIAGSYPSFILSSFKPVITLKGKGSNSVGGVTVRKVFTTTQFAISVGLVICGIVIDRQLYYFRHAETGMDRENVIMIPVNNSFAGNYPAFKQDVSSLAGIEATATSHYAMFRGYDMYFIDGKTKDESTALAALSVDKNYIDLLKLKWKYPPAPGEDLVGTDKVIINEEAINKLHLQQNPVGDFIKSGGQKLEITGVIKNFNFSTMESEIIPLGLFIASDTTKYWSKVGCNLFARIKPHTNLPGLLSNVQNIYKKYDNITPFDYTFMDDAFNQQYKAEDRLASIFSLFTIITIALASMGLFGLAAFTIEQRTKEVGIRKILGASLGNITSLLSADFLKLVLISIMIASPIAWWAMNNWLQNFAYRITISWWVFIAAALIAVIVAIVTVSYYALKTAIANPVKSLRSE